MAEFTDRGIAEAAGGLNTREWLRHKLRETIGAAGVTAKMAVACSPKSPHREIGAALASGKMNPDQALHEAADPDGPSPRDDEQIERLRGVHYRDHHDGTHSITWRDRPETIGLAKAAVGSLDAPKPQQNGAAAPATDSTAAPTPWCRSSVACCATVTCNSRGRAPHLHLTCDLDTLEGLSGAAKAALATGGALTPAAVRLLACDAEITPIVLDAKGKPLSVGRRFRTWTPAIWDALVARDTGCTFPACDVPSGYCIGHHILYWTEHLGPTELGNGVLLCPRHHVEVHHHGWVVRLDEHGIPEFIPPPWIDPSREPRRNHYWQMQKGLLRPVVLPDLIPEE